MQLLATQCWQEAFTQTSALLQNNKCLNVVLYVVAISCTMQLQSPCRRLVCESNIIADIQLNFYRMSITNWGDLWVNTCLLLHQTAIKWNENYVWCMHVGERKCLLSHKIKGLDSPFSIKEKMSESLDDLTLMLGTSSDLILTWQRFKIERCIPIFGATHPNCSTGTKNTH